MTPEDLERIILDGDRARLMAAWRSLSTAERKELSAPAQAIDRALRRDDDAEQAWSVDSPAWHRSLTSLLALLMFGPKRAVMRGAVWAHLETDMVLEVLAERRPDWAAAWLEAHVFEQVSTNRLSIDPPGALEAHASVREPGHPLPTPLALIDAGVCPRPTSAGYFQWIAWFDPEWLLQLVPSLLEHELWGLFRHHTVAFHTNDGNGRAHDWRGFVTRLVDEGRIDRGRVLEACLDGLMAGIDGKATLAALPKVFAGLDPTLDELASLQPRLLALAGHGDATVVGFAVRQLGVLQRKKRLDAAAFLERLSAIAVVPTKGPVKQALAILAKCLQSDPALLERSVGGLREALQHPSVDVQEAALDVLEGAGEVSGDALRTRFAGLALSASLIRRYAAWLGSDVGEAGDTAPSDIPPVRETVPDEVTRDDPSPRTTFAVAPMRAIAPPEYAPDVETLWQVVCAQLDRDREANDYGGLGRLREYVFDGVSRFCDVRPPAENGAARLEQLAGYPSKWNDASTATAGVLRTWLGAPEPEPDASGRGDAPQVQALIRGISVGRGREARAAFPGRRARELMVRVAQRIAIPMLSTPTHSDGWLDAETFGARVQTFVERGLELPVIDFAGAMLRIHPEQAERASLVVSNLPEPLGAALRYAIGHELDPPASLAEGLAWPHVDRRNEKDDLVIPDLEILWVCARRARGRRDLSPTVLGPGNPWSKKPELRFGRWLHRMFLQDEFPDVTVGPWLELAWEITLRIDLPTSRDTPHAAMLQVFVERASTWTPEVHTALAVALFTKDEELRLMATDLVVARIETGRFDPAGFGDIVAQLATGDWAPVTRLAETVHAVAQSGPLARLAMAETLDEVLARCETLPRGSHALLELWLELLIETGSAASMPARSCLTSMKLSGKAKTARQRALAVEQSSAKHERLTKARAAARASAEVTDRADPVPAEAQWSFVRSRFEACPLDAEGRWHGVLRTWTLAGVPGWEVTYAHGVAHGPVRVFHADGSLAEEGTYEHGRRHGVTVWRRALDGSEIPGLPRFAAVVEVFAHGEREANFRFGPDGHPSDGEGRPAPDAPVPRPPTAGYDLEQGCWREHPALAELDLRPQRPG